MPVNFVLMYWCWDCMQNVDAHHRDDVVFTVSKSDGWNNDIVSIHLTFEGSNDALVASLKDNPDSSHNYSIVIRHVGA